MINYAITPEDFLFLSEELGHNIELCTPMQTQVAVVELGFPKGIDYTKKKLRGHVIEQKRAIPTEAGMVRAIASNLVACVSSKDFKISDLTANCRLAYNGELFQIEHKKEYTHRGVSLYHELKLTNPSIASGDTVAQPDENLEYIPSAQPTILQNIQAPQPDFNF